MEAIHIIPQTWFCGWGRGLRSYSWNCSWHTPGAQSLHWNESYNFVISNPCIVHSIQGFLAGVEMAWGLRSFTKHNEGRFEWKPWEQKRVRGSFQSTDKSEPKCRREGKTIENSTGKVLCVHSFIGRIHPPFQKVFKRSKMPKGTDVDGEKGVGWRSTGLNPLPQMRTMT